MESSNIKKQSTVSIKNVFLYGENILIVDSENTLWIMGDNMDRVTGFGNKDKSIYTPFRTGIILENDEEVKKFYVYSHLMAIFTSKGRLFLSRHLNDDKDNSVREIHGTIITGRGSAPISEATRSAIVRRVFAIRNQRQNDSDTENSSDDEMNGENSMDDSDNENNNLNNRIEMDVFNNSAFMEDYDVQKKRVIKEPGFDQFQYYVDDVTFSSDMFFFKKQGKLFLFSYGLETNDIVRFKNFGMCVRIHTSGHYTYFELVPPFDYEKLVLKDNFVYFYANKFHHILTGDPGIIWFYFKTDFNLDENNIHFNPSEYTVYVKNNEKVYKYCHRIQDIKEFVSGNAKVQFVPTNDKTEDVLLCIKNNGLYTDDGGLVRKADSHRLLNNIIDVDYIGVACVLLVNSDTNQRYEINSRDLYFNINGLVYYGFLMEGLIYYDSNNTLYYCTDKNLPEDEYNTTEIDKITIEGETLYIYMFNNIPYPVTNIIFTEEVIIIQSNDKYYYHTIYSSETNFRVHKFTPITIDTVVDVGYSVQVNKNYIMLPKKSFENSVSLNINVDGKKFEKFFNIIEMLNVNTNFEIEFKKNNEIISYGDGAKRELMETALIEFENKYLLKYNNRTEFNLKEMKKMSDDELTTIGTLLHTVICHSNNHLPIRLPLSLLVAFKEKPIKMAEYEYFAKLEDPDMFETIYKYHDKPDEFIELGSNYESYEDCVRSLCCYSKKHENDKDLQRICKLIALGFTNYNDIKNLDVMNYSTLDYYLSGDYMIDRHLLIKNLRVDHKSQEKAINYKEEIIKLIKSLPENKLAILLKNWSGTSVIKKSTRYEIFITPEDSENGVYFATCNVKITINENFIMDNKTYDILLDMLTTPITTMVDNL